MKFWNLIIVRLTRRFGILLIPRISWISRTSKVCTQANSCSATCGPLRNFVGRARAITQFPTDFRRFNRMVFRVLITREDVNKFFRSEKKRARKAVARNARPISLHERTWRDVCKWKDRSLEPRSFIGNPRRLFGGHDERFASSETSPPQFRALCLYGKPAKTKTLKFELRQGEALLPRLT